MLGAIISLIRGKRGEGPFAAFMFAYFFGVIGIFWVLKPLKKGLFIELYDTEPLHLFGWNLAAAQAEQVAKVLNMLAAMGAVIVFTWLSRRLMRQRLVVVITCALAVAMVILAGVIDAAPRWAVWSFYVLGDLFNILMVPAFFAFLGDSVRADQAKRMYGVIVLGGVCGGVFGSTVLRIWIALLPASTWLLICAGISGFIVVAALGAGRMISRFRDEDELDTPLRVPEKTSAAFEGLGLVRGSRYLVSIAVMVGVYEVVSTMVDYQFTSAVSRYLDGPSISVHVSGVYALTNGVALAVQVLLTTAFLSRLGLGRSLAVMPLLIGALGLGFAALPILAIGSLLSICDNGLNYSLNQSAREALFTLATRQEKYRAKAFIDMFVQRFAKTVGVGACFGLSLVLDLRGFAVLTVVLAGVWLVAARYAGRWFDEKQGTGPGKVETNGKEEETKIAASGARAF